MTIRKTAPLERIDMMLAQAETFVRRDLRGEAIARAKQVLAYCDREAARTPGEELREGLEMRKLLAESLIRRLGGSVRNRRGDLKVDADDAAHFDAWA
ncbi:MAG TPA: hypothetical protein RMH99_04495 [Sandaracinaceae bacterium LLY-WYZ-13_1]|nr:hypothetical protein [Sandaracinaceae bacterium LLY-WYZ-13_1]